EMLFGWGKDARNFAVVTVGRGIGAGLVVNGEIYRGASGGAGELGHTVSEAGGRLCECGKRGCLEAYAAEPALLAQAKERFPEFNRH
ncbi:ROK family protein, partial [Acinetobacter baumannii]